jgi:hypothetical protein
VLEHVIHLAVGSGAPRIGGTEHPDDRLAERGRNVHGASVIRHHQLTQARPLDHFQE